MKGIERFIRFMSLGEALFVYIMAVFLPIASSFTMFIQGQYLISIRGFIVSVFITSIFYIVAQFKESKWVIETIK